MWRGSTGRFAFLLWGVMKADDTHRKRERELTMYGWDWEGESGGEGVGGGVASSCSLTHDG